MLGRKAQCPITVTFVNHFRRFDSVRHAVLFVAEFALCVLDLVVVWDGSVFSHFGTGLKVDDTVGFGFDRLG